MTSRIASVTFHRTESVRSDRVVILLESGKAFVVPVTLTGYPFHYAQAVFQSATIRREMLVVEYTDGMEYAQTQYPIWSESL